jgi:hypothetical protein
MIKNWTKTEEENLRTLWDRERDISFLLKSFPKRSSIAIQVKAKRLGLTRKRFKTSGSFKKGSGLGIKQRPEHVEKRRLAITGIRRTAEMKRKNSEWHKGKSWGHHSEASKKKISEAQIGEKNHYWKGGISPINVRIRNSSQMYLWRKAVLERDDFICKKYGIIGGKLVAHHIQNFADFPELRFAIDNGITLSEKAHKEFHKIYGIKNNTRKQMEKFLGYNLYE